MEQQLFDFSQFEDRNIFIGQFEWCRLDDGIEPEPPKPKTVMTETSPERERINKYRRDWYAKNKTKVTTEQRDAKNAKTRQWYVNNKEEHGAKVLKRYHDKKKKENVNA
jgi:hypothetical protein